MKNICDEKTSEQKPYLKPLKILFLVFIYFLIYIFFEFFVFAFLYFTSASYIKEDIKKYGVKMVLDIIDFKDENYENYIHKPIFVKNSKKPAITIFGCSLGYAGDENLFASDLSKLTKRTVYNYSIPGTGPQMMYYAIEKGKINDDSDTYIYVYISDHELRSCKFRCTHFLDFVLPKYNLKNDNSLKIEYPNLFQKMSFIYRAWEFVFPIYYKNGKYSADVFYNLVMQSFQKLKEKNKNIRFIILNYSEIPTENFPFLEEFNNVGIEVVSANDLTSQNMLQEKYYNSPTDMHPNDVAWDMVSKKLVKKCGL